MPEELEQDWMEELTRALDASDTSALLAAAENVHYADLAEIYEDLSEKKRDLLLKTIGPEMATDLVAELPDTLIEEALNHFKPAQLKVLLGNLSDDDRVDVFQDVDDETQGRYFGLLGAEEKELTKNLLKYEEDTAGGRMTTQIGRVTADMKVKEALTELQRDIEDTETLARIFVVDKDDRLVGKLRLRDLAFNTWDTPLRDIMQPVEHTIVASADQEEAVTLFTKYDLIALPVVDEDEHFLGIITHDDAMEILETESTEDIEKIAGISGEQREETYLNTTVLTHFSRRFVWLLVLGFLAIASGYVMLKFESVLDQVFLLALFLPMVIAAGGNTGGQAATLVIRSMAVGELGIGDVARVAWKEFRLGLLLGGVLGICIAATALVVVPQFNPEVPDGFSYQRFALAVALALATQIVTSTLIGSLLPLGAKAIRLDPAVIAHPAITTIVDVTGMIIYFGVAKVLLTI